MHCMTPLYAVSIVPCPLWWTFTLTEAPAPLLFYVSGNPLPRSSLHPPQWLPSFCPASCQMQMNENNYCVFFNFSVLQNEDALGAVKGAFCFWNKHGREKEDVWTISDSSVSTSPSLSVKSMRIFLCFSTFKRRHFTVLLSSCYLCLSAADWPGAGGEGLCHHWPRRIFQWR